MLVTNVNLDQRSTAEWNPYYDRLAGNILLSYQSSGEWGHYVIYEADPWPARKRTERWTLATNNVQETEYRSSDGYYAIGDFVANRNLPEYFEGRGVSNGAIEYTLKKK